jgi:acyl dehydratase
MEKAVNERVFKDFAPGRDLGASDWVTVTQSMIDGFGEATLDHDPMHVDPVWAANGPFGHTIAFGFLTMSLLTHLMHKALGTDSSRYDPAQGYYLNYGFDRLRLISPVPVGSRIRGKFRVEDVRADAGERSIVRFAVEVEVEGAERPAMVALWLSVWVPPAVSQAQ